MQGKKWIGRIHRMVIKVTLCQYTREFNINFSFVSSYFFITARSCAKNLFAGEHNYSIKFNRTHKSAIKILIVSVGEMAIKSKDLASVASSLELNSTSCKWING